VRIAFLLYDGMTALDAVGPYDVLARVPGAEVAFTALEPGPKRTEAGSLALVADHRLEDVPRAEVLVVPGGIGNRGLLEEERILGWLRSVHETTRFTTSVCTGSLLLAAAGILDGLPATTHWLARDQLAELGAQPRPDRVVESGKIITAAGVSAGIDMALRLVRRLAGDELAQAIQLGIEYDPEPPFDSGSPEKAAPEIVEAVRAQRAAAK
jgi:transcriptional regulator GlxA family with amidase domain